MPTAAVACLNLIAALGRAASSLSWTPDSSIPSVSGKAGSGSWKPREATSNG